MATKIAAGTFPLGGMLKI